MSGNLDILKWLREGGFPMKEETCKLAAKVEYLEILQWARQEGCPWDEYTCSYAAEKGYLKILQWAVDNECPDWNNDFNDNCSMAARNGLV